MGEDDPEARLFGKAFDGVSGWVATSNSCAEGVRDPPIRLIATAFKAQRHVHGFFFLSQADPALGQSPKSQSQWQLADRAQHFEVARQMHEPMDIEVDAISPNCGNELDFKATGD